MADIEGRISYAGMTSDTGDTQFTLSLGLDPSVCIMQTDPNGPEPPTLGTLVVEGTFGRWEFRNCACREITAPGGDSPRRRFQIVDRRWRWQVGGGVFRGTYNVREDQTEGTAWGTGQPAPLHNIRSPDLIARDLLTFMGEPNADVSAIPRMNPADFPYFHWEYLPARQCLAQLLDALGLTLTITVGDRIKLVRPGVGAGLPDQYVVEESTGATLLRPDSTLFIAAPTVHEALFQTEPVARDLDGKWKKLDAVSYRPPNGWQQGMDPEFSEIESYYEPPTGVTTDTDKKRAIAAAISLAQQTVWRSYRVTGFADGSRELDIFLRDFTPARARWLATLLGRTFDPVTQQTIDRPIWIEGEFIDNVWTFSPTASGTRYNGAVSLDQEAGVITAADQLVRLDGGNTNPARIFVRLAFCYEDGQTRVPLRYGVSRPLPGPMVGSGATIVKREDVELRVTANFKPTGGGGYTKGAVSSNLQTARQAAEYYLDREQDRHIDAGRSLTRTYVGLMPIEPNGIIQQVSWQTAGGIPSTVASVRREHDVAVQPFAIRKADNLIDHLTRDGQFGRARQARPSDTIRKGN